MDSVNFIGNFDNSKIAVEDWEVFNNDNLNSVLFNNYVMEPEFKDDYLNGVRFVTVDARYVSTVDPILDFRSFRDFMDNGDVDFKLSISLIEERDSNVTVANKYIVSNDYVKVIDLYNKESIIIDM